jgi:hypothetical protein
MVEASETIDTARPGDDEENDNENQVKPQLKPNGKLL